MKKSKFPLPIKYWLYIFLALFFAVFSFVNIYVGDTVIGEKEFYDYSRSDWYLTLLFVLIELVLFTLMIVFSFKAGKIYRNNTSLQEQYYLQFKYIGIETSCYAYVWHDFSGTERALIKKVWKYFFYTLNFLTEI